MKSKWLLVCCLALTAFVVFVATRIELLNIEANYVLPRQQGINEPALAKWVVPELDDVIDRLDEQFYEQRLSVLGLSDAAEPDKAVVKYGPPYSAQEEKFMNNVKKLHSSHSTILWWVKSFGRAQYFLAPAALIIAVFCAVSLSGWLPKSTAGLCAGLSSVSILLMLTRSYWQAIGV